MVYNIIYVKWFTQITKFNICSLGNLPFYLVTLFAFYSLVTLFMVHGLIMFLRSYV